MHRAKIYTILICRLALEVLPIFQKRYWFPVLQIWDKATALRHMKNSNPRALKLIFLITKICSMIFKC